MHDTLRALRALQELDQDIFRLREELRRLPEERAERRSRIDTVIQRRDELSARLHELRGRVKEIEDLTTIQRQRMRKVEGEAANSRGDMALLAAYQHQVRTLKRDIGSAEEEGLALVEKTDEGQTELARLEAEIEEAEKSFAEFSANVESEMATAASKLETLEKERAGRMSGDVDKEGLALYERLLEVREGVALAELEGRVCQACFMEVPSNVYVRVARGSSLNQCPSCHRIFYIRD